MSDHPLVLLAGAIAVAWFMLKSNPKLSSFVSIAAPAGILACLIWEFAIPKRSQIAPTFVKAASAPSFSSPDSAKQVVEGAAEAARTAASAVAGATDAATAKSDSHRDEAQPPAVAPAASIAQFDWSRYRPGRSLTLPPTYSESPIWKHQWKWRQAQPTYAVVRPQGEINMRECPGADCAVIAQLQRSAIIKRTGKLKTIETDSGARFEWIEVSTDGSSYCLPKALDADAGCTRWSDSPPLTGWVNKSLTRDTQ